ncbi:hypothetical protein [Neobacillus terrae]|uniref:hypothetical protein n=1 Tax=Neobacillus terrae TaxID=3034837 RepID=UPI00140A8663|nr:hypothetical protein [Neobacillus terrae]NHM33652.1 hypothetical protein [Neobacillus terrae]
MQIRRKIISLLLLVIAVNLLNACSTQEKENKNAVEKPSPITKGDGQGLYDGMYCGLVDRDHFNFSKAMLGAKKTIFDTKNVDEITNNLIIKVLSQRSSTNFMNLQSAENKLGKSYVKAYIKAFKEGYCKSLKSTDKEAVSYKKLVEKVNQ